MVIRSSVLGRALALGLVGAGLAMPADAAAKHYANCTAMHKAYPHGVGKKGAKDKTSGARVTTFKVSNSLYAANKGSDRDHDGIACEKR